MLNNRAKNTALGLAALGLGGYLGYNYGHAPDVICPTEVRLLPACGAHDEGPGPSPPPMAALVTVVSTNSTAIISDRMYINAVTDEEQRVPPKAGSLSITLA
jgi:hypothetical protein